MALINFKLKHPDSIAPWGDGPDTSMDWLGLTEGAYWLDLNKAILYEYTDEVLTGEEETTYVEYPLARLTEDVSALFESIAAPVPDTFYSIAKSNHYLYRFYGAVQQWLEQLSDQVTYDRYEKAIAWIYSRTLIAMHLTGGPGISFFRNGEKLAIVWKADYLTENDKPVWTAGNGEMEMPYESFVREVEDFGERFFKAMDTQVQLAIGKDWGTAYINKERLVQEQQERKVAWGQKVALLKGKSAKSTDWEQINSLITEMFS
jgi:hypothetical protein